MLKKKRCGILSVFAFVLMFAAGGAVIGADLDFSGLMAGYILDGQDLSTGHGISGDINGVVRVSGFPNPAIVFDSLCPPNYSSGDCSGRDTDLGTPNECVPNTLINPGFYGPGVDRDLGDGLGGECASLFPNLVPLYNLAIVAEDLEDSNGDGLVDDPDDADVAGEYIEVDFSGIAGKGVTVNCFTYIDNDQGEDDAMAFFWQHGQSTSDPPIDSFGLTALGDNGVLTICPGIEEVETMRILLDGSGALASVLIEEEVPSDCWVTLGGFNKNTGTVTDPSGKKICTFGGNVGPPPSGSFEVNWHDGPLAGSKYHTHDIEKIRCEDLTDGPGQPGGKKGFVQDTLFFDCSDGKFNGSSGYTCLGYFQDNKEPQGKKNNDPDAVCIEVYDSGGNPVASCGVGCDPENGDPDLGGGWMDSPIDGGNVQIHPCNGNQCVD